MKDRLTKILPGITSTSRRYGWQAKIDEVRRLGLKEVALFPTLLAAPERQLLYRELENSPLERLPFVHLRSDMSAAEVDYLIHRFHTERFNIHPRKRHAQDYDLSAFNGRIFVENMYDQELEESDLAGRGGICLDVSHLEDCRLRRPEMYRHVVARLGEYPCGCWHVSAVTNGTSDRSSVSAFYAAIEAVEGGGAKSGRSADFGTGGFSVHVFSDLSEFDYVARYRPYLPEIMAMELENPLAEQLKAIEHLKGVIGIR